MACSRPAQYVGFITDENRRLQSAGVNRHEAEEEESLRERSSEPLGPEFCSGHREVLAEA